MDPQKLMEENAMLKAKIAELEAKLGTTDAAKTDAQKRADEATASAAEAAKNLEEGTSPEKLDTLVEERTDAIDAFLSVCPKGRENEIKGKPTKTIREMALKLVDPEFKTDGADPEAEIRGAFKLAFSKRKGNSADLRRGAAAARLGMGDIETRKDSIETEPSSSDARKKMIEANRQASQGKLSAHK